MGPLRSQEGGGAPVCTGRQPRAFQAIGAEGDQHIPNSCGTASDQAAASRGLAVRAVAIHLGTDGRLNPTGPGVNVDAMRLAGCAQGLRGDAQLAQRRVDVVERRQPRQKAAAAFALEADAAKALVVWLVRLCDWSELKEKYILSLLD